MTDHKGPIPIPARITHALDSIGAYGPEVDQQLGGEEPMVDEWEAGLRVPTLHQIQLLAQMTRKPISFFYRPVQDWEMKPQRIFICERGRRGENGLTILNSWIDWAGVQHVEQETPDRPPKRAPKAAPAAAPAPKRRPGACTPTPDPDTPGCCTCGLPLSAARHR